MLLPMRPHKQLYLRPPELMLTSTLSCRANPVGGLPPHRKACSGEHAGDLGYDLAEALIALSAAADRLSVCSHRLKKLVLICSLTVSAFPSALSTLVVPVPRASLRFVACSSAHLCESHPTELNMLVFCVSNALSELLKPCGACLWGTAKVLRAELKSLVRSQACPAHARSLLMRRVLAGHPRHLSSHGR